MAAGVSAEGAGVRPTVLEVKELRKVFLSWRWLRLGGVPLPVKTPLRVEAVAGLDLAVEEGEIYGFLGPNGAGKTTTIKMLMGLIRPSGGEMRIFGGAPEALATRARIGYLPEHPYFYDYLKPLEILDFYGRLFGLPRAVRRERSERLLRQVGMWEARERRLRLLSKGMLQRVGIASALVNDPDLVVLDEPLSGLDPIGRKEMRDIIVGLRQVGKTVFFSSHILSDAELVCDKVAILDRGVLRCVGRLDELLDSERVGTEVVVQGLRETSGLAGAVAGARVESLGAHLRVTVEEAGTDAVLRWVLAAGGSVVSVVRRRESLEDLFVRHAVRGGER